MYGYEGALASLLPANSELLKKLIAMIDEEGRFRAGEYKKHLHDESPCRDHCMGHLLSAFKNASFRGDCIIVVTTVAPTGRKLLRASQ